MLTFQHIGTARHNDADYNMTAMLYGRKADGTSVAVSVTGITAYGFLNCNCDSQFRHSVHSLVQWYMSMQRTESSSKKYRRENGQERPCGEVFRQWNTYWFDKCEIAPGDITWTQTSGFNIRRVTSEEPPVVFRFQVRKFNLWRALLALFKNPAGTYQKLLDFRRKMVNSAGKSTVKSIPNPIEAYLEQADIYETMFQPELVWMVDCQLPACSWMQISNPIRLRVGQTTCGEEYRCTSVAVAPCYSPPIPMAPFRVLSYDIEAVPYVDPDSGECKFPIATRDCISTIGVTCFDIVSAKMVQTVFMLELKGQPQCQQLSMLTADKQTDDYDPSTTTVHSFLDELEMLTAFAAKIREYDPDLITGFNVLNFDNVYLIERIQALCGCEKDKNGVPNPYCLDCMTARTFSRVGKPSILKKKYTYSKQRGGQESWETSMEGRDWMDVYRVVMSDHKLRSYKLDNVCAELLGTKKIHIAYDDIPEHQKTPAGREFLAQYCVKDAWLPCQIIVKRCKLVNAIQMAQVTGVLLTSILHRGQQIRTMLLMLQFIKARCRKDPRHPRYYLPDESGKKHVVADGFEGAVVITPKPGFYQTPVVTLDFASLYPSIMRAYNMCFSTLVPSFKEARHLQWSAKTHNIKDPTEENYPEVRPVRSFDYPEGGKFEYVVKDTDVCFVTTKKRVGILPEILEQLLSNRKRVKKMRKQFDEKSMDYAVLDGRQLALKVCANSVYGFTGAGQGYLGEKRIASSVTRVGRGMANHTKWMCEDRYKEHGLEIVYGDTVR
jgi:DNA polymerase delta subunit 1